MPKRLLSFLRPKDGGLAQVLGGLGVTAGFLWGAWVFLFQEILRPAVAPVNISLGLEVKRLKPLTQSDGNPLPVLLTVSAKNASPKILTIRKTFWVGHAIILPRGEDGLIEPRYQEQDVITDVNQQMSLGRDVLSLEGTATTRYQRANDAWEVVGFGPLFDVNEIRPQEEIKAQRLILVPRKTPSGSFNLLRVRVVIPSYAKRSVLADEDLIRVVGGISSPSKDFVQVSFCQAERDWKRHGLRWFFDKFALPRDRFDTQVFLEPGSQYCPTPMTPEQRERVGAQVFISTYEIPLDVSQESGS